MATAVAKKKNAEAGYILTVQAKLKELRLALDRFDCKISTSFHGHGFCLTWEAGINSKGDPIATVDNEQVLITRYLFERFLELVDEGSRP